MERKDEFRLFIGKVPPLVTEEDISRHFSQFGTIKQVLYPKTERPTKIAFVTFTSKEGLDAALSQRHEFGGIELNVTKALPKNVRPAPPSFDQKENTRIFVGGLPPDTSDSELELYFSRFGTITKIQQPPLKGTESQAYAFITFSTPQEKSAALLSSTHHFKGVELRVVEAKPKQIRGESVGASYYSTPTIDSIPSLAALESRPDPELDNPTRVFVGKLPNDTTKEELKEYFGAFGTVADIFQPSTQASSSSEPKGFAFVTYRESKELWKCLACCPHTFKGHKIEVVEARPKTSARRMPSQLSLGQPEPRIFVGRIPVEVSEAEVKQYFNKFGNVTDVFRPKQNVSKDGVYFAFVVFETMTDVAKALAEDSHSINQTTLNVIRARPRISREIRETVAAAAAAAVFGASSVYSHPAPSAYMAPTSSFGNGGASPYSTSRPQVPNNPYLVDPYSGGGSGITSASALSGASGYEEYDPYQMSVPLAVGSSYHSNPPKPSARSLASYGPASITTTSARYKPY